MKYMVITGHGHEVFNKILNNATKSGWKPAEGHQLVVNWLARKEMPSYSLLLQQEIK